MASREFQCANVFIGQELRDKIAAVKKFPRKRYCCEQLEEYLNNPYSVNTLALYGLRRTGKTTMMLQIIKEMPDEDLDKTCFIQIAGPQKINGGWVEGDTIKKLRHDLRYLFSYKGFKYAFIDEITVLSDFISNGALLTDSLGVPNGKIILSGTDSLSFYFMNSDNPYKKQETISTSYVSYKEFHELLSQEGAEYLDIDKFMEYGGVLIPETNDGNPDYKLSPFATPASAHQYLNSAISKNILHSLKNIHLLQKYSSLAPLVNENSLVGIINRIIAYINIQPALNTLTNISLRKLARNPHVDVLKNTLKELSLDNVNKIIEPSVLSILEKHVVKDYYARFGINSEISCQQIDRTQLSEIEEYLFELKLLKKIERNRITIAQNISKLGKHSDIFIVPDEYDRPVTIDNEIVVLQPGMRYCFASEFVKVLRKNHIRISKDNCVSLKNGINAIKGHILEDLILTDTDIIIEKWNDKLSDTDGYKLFKLNIIKQEIFEKTLENRSRVVSYDKEIDMVIYDPTYDGVHLFEIKHSAEAMNNAMEHLLSEEVEWVFCNIYEKPILSRNVLYRGEEQNINGIHFRNIEDFLKNLDENNIGSVLEADVSNIEIEITETDIYEG